MATVLVKKNRDETLSGKVTFTSDVKQTAGKWIPLAAGVNPTLTTTLAKALPVYNAAGTLLGYVPVYTAS